MVKKIQSYIGQRGGRAFKIHGGAKGYESAFQEIGIPDLLVVFQGHFIGLEVKQVGGKPSSIQRKVLKEIEAAGGVAAVVRSVKEVEAILDSLIPVEAAAWIAGFFDGEGSVSIYQKRYPRINIYQKDTEPLLWIQEILGMGRLVFRGDRGSAFLNISRREDVIRFLNLIDPHVRLRHRRLKLEEAKEALTKTQSIRSSSKAR